MIIPVEKSWHDGEPHVAAVELLAGDEAGQAMPRRVDKTWGYELHYRNDDRYCMKALHFNGPKATSLPEKINDNTISTSLHFHVIKHETLLVTSGVLTLELIINKERKVHKLPTGTAWVICPGHMHRLSALDGPVVIIEASTKDYTDDSIRIN